MAVPRNAVMRRVQRYDDGRSELINFIPEAGQRLDGDVLMPDVLVATYSASACHHGNVV